MKIQTEIYSVQQVRDMLDAGELRSISGRPIAFLREDVAPGYSYLACIATLPGNPRHAVGFLLHTVRNRAAKIQFIFVDAEWRNKKIATQMISTMLDHPDNTQLNHLEMQSTTDEGDRLITTLVRACAWRFEVLAKASPFLG